MKRFSILWLMIGALLIMAAPMVLPAQAESPLQGGNILANPGFEDPFAGGGFGVTAQGWSPWHRDTGKLNCDDQAYAVQPGWWRETNRELNFVLDGFTSQGVGNQFDTWDGGVLQTVAVTAGQRYRFTFQGRLRASNEQVPQPSDFNVGVAQAGIDPNGSGVWSDADVVWGGSVSPVDAWQTASVEATATGNQMTVYTRINFAGAGNCRAHLDSWVDNASLTPIEGGTGTGSGSGSGSGTQPTSPPPPVAQVTSGPTPTPDADGYIWMAVPAGGSMWTVASLAGITVQELADLNNMSTSDFVQQGQLLIVARVEPSVPPTETPDPDAEETEGEEPDEDETAEPEASDTPETTSTPTPISGGMICVNAFGDTDGNGLHETAEGYMAGVTFTISQEGDPLSQGISRGTEDPVCFQGIPAGSYDVREILPAGLEPTTATEISLDLEEGQQISLEFGTRIRTDAGSGQDNSEEVAEAGDDQPTPDAESEDVSPTSQPAQEDGDAAGSLGVAAISGILLLAVAILLLGGLIMMLVRQR